MVVNLDESILTNDDDQGNPSAAEQAKNADFNALLQELKVKFNQDSTTFNEKSKS